MQFDHNEIYQRKFLKAFRKNVEDAGRMARIGKLDKKIKTFCELHGCSKESLIREIEKNEIVAACFAINPSKQNFYKKEAARIIQSLDRVRNFHGPNHQPKKIIVNGEVIQESSVSKSKNSSDTKPIDFWWEFEGRVFLACHKYTKESGGAQNQQFREFQRTINLSELHLDSSTYFVAIVDGPYFEEKKDEKTDSRLDTLKKQTTPQTFACNIGELENLMVQICCLEK